MQWEPSSQPFLRHLRPSVQGMRAGDGNHVRMPSLAVTNRQRFEALLSLINQRGEMGLPFGRYIAWVGAALLALLFAVNWLFPPSEQKAVAETFEKPVIRITSSQRLPERVDFDTSQPQTGDAPAALASSYATPTPPPQPVLASSYASGMRPPFSKKSLHRSRVAAKRSLPRTFLAARGPLWDRFSE